MTRPVITLTTDFGDDLFAGVMKGVIVGVNPEARVIDLTHAITPGDVRAGAFALLAGCRYFPPGAIHVVVVDPGVGSSRRVLCVRTREATFLAPDNGVLSWVLGRDAPVEIRAVENRTFFLEHVSHTFHGRDVFAPVAAHLSLGVEPEELGPEIPPDDIARMPFPQPERPDARTLRGEILTIDRFGNCISNIGAEEVTKADPPSVQVEAASLCLSGLHTSYADAAAGTPLAIIGSAGFVEIAVSGASAARRFGLKVGDTVTLTL